MIKEFFATRAPETAGVAAAKVGLPVTVTAAVEVFGIQVDSLVIWGTLIYVVLMILDKALTSWYRRKREQREEQSFLRTGDAQHPADES